MILDLTDNKATVAFRSSGFLSGHCESYAKYRLWPCGGNYPITIFLLDG